MMFHKCTCKNCSGHLEFEAEHAGETIACPHCELDTILFIPQAPRKPPAGRRRTILIVLFFAGLLAVGILGSLLTPTMERLAPAAGAVLNVLLSAALALVVIAWAILWIIFPVFVYFNLRKMNETLAQIESHLRPTRRVAIETREPESASSAEAFAPAPLQNAPPVR